MANRYWVGGTASWDGTAGTKWASTSGGAGGASVPTSADDVFFDANSTGTVTIAVGNTGAKSITCTGFTGTITGSSAISVAGSITLVAGMTYTHTGTVTITGTGTLTTAGKTFSGVTVNGSGITVSLGDALNVGTRTVTVTQGTFTTTASNYSITAGVLSSSNSNTRTVALNNSTINLSNQTTPWNTGTITNLTLTGGTCTINITGGSCTVATGGASIPGTMVFAGIDGTDYKSGGYAITGAATFVNLTFNGDPDTNDQVVYCSLSANITVTGTLTCSSTNPWGRVFLYSSVYGTARTITAAAVSLTDVDFQDITGAGAASWTGTRLGNAQGNTNITFPAPKTVYWGNTSTALANYGSANWATSIGGATSGTNFPLPQDTAVFPSSYPGSGGRISIYSFNIGTIDASARTSSTLALEVEAVAAVFGDLICGTGVTTPVNIGATWRFSNRTSQSFTPPTSAVGSGVIVDTLTGTVTLNGDYNSTGNYGDFTLTSGTFDLNGYNFTASDFVFGTGSGLTRSLNIPSGSVFSCGNDWNIGAAGTTTVTGTGTIRMTRATAKTFTPNSVSYSNITIDQGGAGTLTFAAAVTFANITNSYGATGATAINFTAGTTNTFTNWNASGTAGKLLTVTSATAATHTLSKSSGTVNAEYLNLSYSTATGGATWNALNSVDSGNNTGWIITAAPPSSGNFLMFFI